ncbi:DUF333 domain-containing protein [Brucella sp. IR073]|uniref:putative hemolysin n=1 Tax=unclassified Brucella TaxID=2632610 RepID=UPI003B983820
MQRALLLCALSLLIGCTSSRDGRAGMANPASVYCVDIGGKLEIRDTPQGQAGYCHLPDGRVIDEWRLFSAHRQLEMRKRTMPAP